MQSSILNFFSNQSDSIKKKCDKPLKRRSKSYDEVVVISSDEDDQLSHRSSKRALITLEKTLENKKYTESNCKTNGKPVNYLSLNGNDKKEIIETKKDNAAYEEKNLAFSFDEPYYLKNFKLAITSVLNDENEVKLFEGEDASWLEKFDELPNTSKKLYVRLFHRKIAWLPLNKVSYKILRTNFYHSLNLA